MTTRDELHKMIDGLNRDQLPLAKAAILSALHSKERAQEKKFREALDYTIQKYDGVLKRLANR